MHILEIDVASCGCAWSMDCAMPALGYLQSVGRHTRSARPNSCACNCIDRHAVLCRGMPGNAAPELLKRAAWFGTCPKVDGRKADVYSLGKTIMTMVLLQQAQPGRGFGEEMHAFKVMPVCLCVRRLLQHPSWACPPG